MSTPYEEQTEKLGTLMSRAKEIGEEIRSFKAETGEQSAEQLQRIEDLKAEQEKLREEMNTVHAERVAAKAQEDSDALLARTQEMLDEWDKTKGRTPSKADLLGGRAASPLDSAAAGIANFHALVAKARDYRDL